MSFLSAQWRKLAIANYVIDEQLLLHYLPAGTELDLWEGKCYVSLVGFMFLETKLRGIKIPFHTNFEEVNLRFYVKRFENGESKRGVVFIREIVPKPALSFVANTIYKENYVTLPMKHNWRTENGSLRVEYNWKKSGKWQSFAVETTPVSTEIMPGSETEFITEHYWGYAKVNNRTTHEYEVTHPRWQRYELNNYQINVDFGLTYGAEFTFLNELQPVSVMLAEGSEITVENKRKIRV